MWEDTEAEKGRVSLVNSIRQKSPPRARNHSLPVNRLIVCLQVAVELDLPTLGLDDKLLGAGDFGFGAAAASR